jgi:hypothetical protein
MLHFRKYDLQVVTYFSKMVFIFVEITSKSNGNFKFNLTSDLNVWLTSCNLLFQDGVHLNRNSTMNGFAPWTVFVYEQICKLTHSHLEHFEKKKQIFPGSLHEQISMMNKNS